MKNLKNAKGEDLHLFAYEEWDGGCSALYFDEEAKRFIEEHYKTDGIIANLISGYDTKERAKWEYKKRNYPDSL